MPELLRTKLYIPRPRPNLVLRPRLSQRLNAGLERKLTLIAAPAGFGKTTLLSEWIPQSPYCVTWLSLDEGDNDPTRFWSYAIASVQQIHPDLGASALALLQSPQTPPIQAILNSLINEIAAYPDRFAAVLDDYHVIEAPAIHEALGYLLEHLPANMHLVLATRSDPPLSLARLRARDELNEFRANDLRFMPEEAQEFLTRSAGLSLTEGEVEVLERRTEGWAAGLQIAALSLQGRADIPGFIEAFSGSHRHILGYLAEEVLNGLPEGTLEFLLRTSILERLCAGLCEAVTGEGGAQAVLEEMEHANLFLTPLDGEGTWYRYHPLFAEVLRARLQQVYGEAVPELHRRACHWHARAGFMEDAIHYALAAPDFAESARLIARITPLYVQRGESKTISNWINRLPPEDVFRNDDLLSYQGWLLYVAGHVGQAKQHVADAQALINRETSAVARGRLAYLASQFAIPEGNMAVVKAYALEALELIGEEDPFFRVLALMTLAGIQTLSGNTGEAIDRLREAARIGENSGQPLPTMVAYAKLADQLNQHGRLQEAQEICERAMNLYMNSAGQPSPISGIAFVEGAKLAYEEDDLHALEHYLGMAIVQDELLGMTGLTFEIRYAQILNERAKGNLEAALLIAEKGSEEAQNAGFKGYISIFKTQEAALLLKIGDVRGVVSRVEALNLASIPGDDLAHLQENLVFARYLVAQDQLDESVALLDGLEKAASRVEYNRHLITIWILRALLAQRQDDPEQAIENLEQALRLAAAQNYRRAFIDEGEPMRLLLQQVQAKMKASIRKIGDSEALQFLTFTETLLAAFSPASPGERPGQGAMIEPLSERELEILRLIASGCTNQEIADLLVIAVSTVKSHINHLYGKLGINRRTQAVAMARNLGLLTE